MNGPHPVENGPRGENGPQSGSGPLEGRVIGVGVDVVSLERLADTLRRTPGVAERIMAPGELEPAVDVGLDAESGVGRLDQRVAAVFAVKEAVMKSLGAGLTDVALSDIAVPGLAAPSRAEPDPGSASRSGHSGRVEIQLSGRALERAVALGVSRVEVSVATEHDSAGSAFVVAEAFAFG